MTNSRPTTTRTLPKPSRMKRSGPDERRPWLRPPRMHSTFVVCMNKWRFLYLFDAISLLFRLHNHVSIPLTFYNHLCIHLFATQSISDRKPWHSKWPFRHLRTLPPPRPMRPWPLQRVVEQERVELAQEVLSEDWPVLP